MIGPKIEIYESMKAYLQRVLVLGTAKSDRLENTHIKKISIENNWIYNFFLLLLLQISLILMDNFIAVYSCFKYLFKNVKNNFRCAIHITKVRFVAELQNYGLLY